MITIDQFIVTILKKSINKEKRYPNFLTPCGTKRMINCGTTVWLGWNHASLETCCWSPAHKLSWVFPNYLLGNNQLIVAGSCWQSMGEVGCKDVYSAALINSFWLLWLLVTIHRFHGRHWFVCKRLPTCTETKKCDTKWKWDCHSAAGWGINISP